MYSLSGRLRVKEEYLIPAITNETPLEYIIPTTTEAGACTTALVDFLTLTHNDFIERCRSLISRQEQRYLQPIIPKLFCCIIIIISCLLCI